MCVQSFVGEQQRGTTAPLHRSMSIFTGTARTQPSTTTKFIITITAVLATLCNQDTQAEAKIIPVSVLDGIPLSRGSPTQAVAKSLGAKAITFWLLLGRLEWPTSVHRTFAQSATQQWTTLHQWNNASNFGPVNDFTNYQRNYGQRSMLNSANIKTTKRDSHDEDVQEGNEYGSYFNNEKMFEISNHLPHYFNKTETLQKTATDDAHLESDYLDMKFSPPSKRGFCCNSHGICRTCLEDMDAEEVVDHYTDYFTDVPKSLITFSKQGKNQDMHCTHLSVPLFPVELHSEILDPFWIADVKIMGWCPSILVTRSLGAHVFPSAVVEQHCLCHEKKCSSQGVDFRCVSVHRNVSTWVRHRTEYRTGRHYEPQSVQVKIGCACVQKPASWAAGINSIFSLI